MTGRHVAEIDTQTDRDTRLDVLAHRVGLVLQEYLTEYYPDADTTVIEWAAAVEYSTPHLERMRGAKRQIVCETDRISLSSIQGLGLYMSGQVS